MIRTTGNANAQFQHAVVLGGGGMGIDAYRKVIALAGGAGNARIGVITAAADGGRHFAHADGYTGMFRSLGVANVEWIPVHEDAKDNAYDPALVEKVRGMNVVFFGGGSQNRLIGVLVDADGRDTPVLAEIKKRFQAKQMIIAGDSAGAASQAKGPAITSGDSYEALTRPSVPTTEIYNGEDLSYNPRGGLGFFPFAIDTHFSERGREGRLIKFAAETEQPLAFGVDEGTALFLTDPLDEGKREATVSGQGGVTIFDLNHAAIHGEDSFSIDGVDMAYLTQGDRYSPDRRETQFAPWKREVDAGQSVSTPARLRVLRGDIFGAPHVGQVDSDDPAVVSAKRDASRKHPGAFREVALAFVGSRAQNVDAMAYESRQHGKRAVNVELLKTDWTKAVASKRSFEHVALNIHA